MRKPPLPEIAMVALTVAWGLSFVVVPWALEDAGYLTVTCLRMAVGVAGLLAIRPSALRGTALEWRAGVIGGLLLAGGYLLQTAGLAEAKSGTSGFLTAFYVSLVPVFEGLMYRRMPERRDLAALAVATAGIALLTLHADLTLSLGETLVAVSAVCWAAQIVVIGRVAARADPVRLAAIQILVVAVVSGAGLVASPEPPVRWTPSLIVSILFLGLVTNALGFLLQAWAQKVIAPTRIAVLCSAEPVFAAAFGVWLRQEPFGTRDVWGAVLILAAVALTVWLPRPEVAAERSGR